MMSGVPGPPPGGGENIKSKIMLDIKSELKTEVSKFQECYYLIL